MNGAGFGAFANGMKSGYLTGKSIKEGMDEREAQRLAEEKARRDAEQAAQVADPVVSETADAMQRAEDEANANQFQVGAPQQQSQQGGMSISPQSFQQFMPQSGAAAGGAAAGGGSFSAAGAAPAIQSGVGSTIGGMAPGGGMGLPSAASMGFGGGAAAGGGGGGAASGGAGAIGAGGPWAALAALIIGNEKMQRNKGNRSEGGKYWTDLISGNKLVERDADTNGEKIDPGNKLGLKGDYQLAGDLTSFDLKNSVKNVEDTFGVKTLKKLIGR